MTELGHNNSNSQGHEAIAADVRAVWKTGVIIVGVVVGAFVLMFGIMKWFAERAGKPPAGQSAKSDVDFAETLPLQQLRIREWQVLTGYEWVDEQAGTARIPIERAMEIVAQTGISSALEPPTAAPPAERQPRETQPPAETEIDVQ